MKILLHIRYAIFVFVFPTFTSTALAADKDETYAHGQEIHQEHCNKCHTDQVYKRSDRFVNSINALGKQVRRCKDTNDVPWFDDDTDAVVHFLNAKYYKF